MIKEQYLEKIKNETGMTKRDIDKVINCFVDLMKKNLVEKTKINLANFGTFSISRFNPKQIFSPEDGRTIKTSNIYKVYFRQSKEFKDYIKKELE
ncbi:MAG: HU family DNA-binding protein [Bacilli bacterium]|nr:HU family DNA-binding protein [Bacilli bacterium]MDD4076957.1 HU family DNA-binding protein [Bacilli bacterium]